MSSVAWFVVQSPSRQYTFTSSASQSVIHTGFRSTTAKRHNYPMLFSKIESFYCNLFVAKLNDNQPEVGQRLNRNNFRSGRFQESRSQRKILWRWSDWPVKYGIDTVSIRVVIREFRLFFVNWHTISTRLCQDRNTVSKAVC